MTAAPNVAPAPPPVADAPPAPAAIAPVDPLIFTADMPEFPAPVLEALATPVDYAWCELRKVKEDSDRELLYVPWIHYQQILVKAFGVGGFKLVPRSVPRTEGNVITWVGALFVRIPGTTRFHFIKEAKGECNSRLGAGNAAEGAESDCLTKCCKRLNIFMELYDPAWRAAWERNYKGTHRQDRAKAAWPAARAGAAPAVTHPPTPSASPPMESGSSPGAVPVGEPSSGPSSPADTGEAATDEQKTAIRAEVKRRKWTAKYARLWLKQYYGTETPDGLTVQQADAALVEVLKWKGPVA